MTSTSHRLFGHAAAALSLSGPARGEGAITAFYSSILTADERMFYETSNQPDFNSPLPWSNDRAWAGSPGVADVASSIP
jgi:hypothetical protein